MSLLSPGGTVCDGQPISLFTFPVTSATTGTDTACAANILFYAAIYVPGKTQITGINFLIGSVGGTDKAIGSIYDISGNLLANTAVAGVIVGTTATTQALPLTVPKLLDGPNFYLVGLTFNGTTAKFRSIPVYCDNGTVGGSVAQTFGTPATIAPSQTKFTADKGPILNLY